MTFEHQGLPAPYLAPGSSSFAEFLASMGRFPAALPGADGLGQGELAAPHGTTIVALRGAFGSVMAGDRRATMGNVIAQRDIEKVFAADDHTLVRLFQVELEHYEKIEGVSLSLDGKANRLATLLRGNLGLAMQGLSVVPLLAGYDIDRDRGRLYSYDVTGGRYEEHDFYAVGSGSFFARGSLKKLYDAQASESSAIMTALQALYDAADDDSATGGPDLTRRIFPIVGVSTVDGVRMVPEAEIEALVTRLVDERMRQPDGPRATEVRP